MVEERLAGDAAHTLRMSVMRLNRRLRRERPDSGLSLTGISALGRVDRDGPITAGQLAEAEGIQPQSVTRVVADLERRGLIERLQDEVDRRRILLRVSDSGRELIAEDRRRRDEWLAVAMAATLTPAEHDILLVAARLIDQLVDS
ncbi:MAG TPA: MarR family transcriptional regulator [Pseudonocardiaceae bacterium]|jgi:DNA-binding MarR family transcriptional regulator|nr:MarR family transcriptional regulator [Pseudonocardiaceae bacterium]